MTQECVIGLGFKFKIIIKSSLSFIKKRLIVHNVMLYPSFKLVFKFVYFVSFNQSIYIFFQFLLYLFIHNISHIIILKIK